MGPQTVAPVLQEEEPPAIPARRDSLGKTSSDTTRLITDSSNKSHLFSFRLVSESSVTSSHQSANQPPPKTNLSRQGSIVSAPVPVPQNKIPALDDSEDTMKNLRKTFAGIFGEM